MSTDCGLRGLDLLDAAIEQIERHPETWEQRDWRCGSGCCLAGQAALLAGGEWVEPHNPTCDYMTAMRDDPDDPDDPGAWIHVADRALRLLGLPSDEMCQLLGNDDDLRELFGATNTLDDIKAMRDDLRAKFAAVAS